MQTGERARARPPEWREKNVLSSLFMFVVWCGALYKREVWKYTPLNRQQRAGCGFFRSIFLSFCFFFAFSVLFRIWMVACMRCIRLRVRSIYGKGSYQIHSRFDKIKTSIARNSRSFCNRNRCGILTNELKWKTKEMKIPLKTMALLALWIGCAKMLVDIYAVLMAYWNRMWVAWKRKSIFSHTHSILNALVFVQCHGIWRAKVKVHRRHDAHCWMSQ